MKKSLISIILILVCLVSLVPNFAFAGDINTNDFNGIYDSSGTSKITKAGGSILGVVQVIGVSIGIICLIMLGVKYMMSSTNDKATIKERLIPYVIGAVIMFGGTGILTIIANFARTMGS